ncbi:blastula protease 10-like [Diadema antillarum]|uniref:blastula protease 10-like n=1 Tax=Diadema antillarum TaxID=105358 RepID=UPI003A8C386F
MKGTASAAVLILALFLIGSDALPANTGYLRRQERNALPPSAQIEGAAETPVDDVGTEPLQDASTQGRPEPAEEEESEGAFQSDMMLTDAQWEALNAMLNDQEQANNDENDEDDDDGEESKSRKKRKAWIFENSRWPQKIVPYEITASSIPDTNVILAAMQHWSDNTCLRFQPYSTSQRATLGHDDRVMFIKDYRGCWSYVGRIGGAQALSIGQGCANVGTVSHEIGHAIGFHHEQSRPDRDNYINVHWENIHEGSERNFYRYSWSQVTTEEVPYDVGSLMHYGMNYFSKNGLPTITTKDPALSGLLGNRDALTFNDIKLANIIYDCNGHCTASLVCLNGGYQGPDCGCVCPPGFHGTFCQTGDEPVDPEECVFTFTEASGEIRSPNYPNNYNDMTDCTYRIKGGKDSSITIIFRDFDLEDHATCDYDYLAVQTGDNSGQGAKYCGSTFPPARYVRNDELVLTFHSDQYVNGRGFRISYFIYGRLITEETTTLPPTTTITTTTELPEVMTTEGDDSGGFVGTCGGYFGALSGMIASPQYPTGYPNNNVCLYTIQVPAGRRIELSFHELDIEYTGQCTGDFLSVDIGDGIDVPMRLCGSDTPTGSIISMENKMMLRLNTDSSGSRRGFAAMYRSVNL